jgi:hypothetical protein
LRLREGLPFALGFEPMQMVPVPATIRRCSLVAYAWLLTACPPWPGWEGCQNEECGSTSSSAPADEWATPTTSGEFQTVTGGEGSSSGIAPEPGTGSTTIGEPAMAPTIVSVVLTPNPIQFNGAIAVTVTAEHADDVRMDLEEEKGIKLVMGEPGVFTGEIPVFTGLDNGDFDALLTPRREAVEGVEAVVGAEVAAPYSIGLPMPGSQLYWESDDALGTGQVEALGVLPDGDVVEFGTHHPNGAPRCYLRRRNKDGTVGPYAVEPVLPDSECSAVDMRVDAQGAMFVLVRRPSADGQLWWLGRVSAWGLGVNKLGVGTKGETAAALAHHPSGTVVVCGSAPTSGTDVDAMVQIFRPNLEAVQWNLDYQPDGKKPHLFDEWTQDCVFVGDTLVLVGEAHGRHALEAVKRDRLFIVRVDLEAKSSAWFGAPSGARTQSGAQAVAVDDQGRLVVAGYTCDDICEPDGDLRIYDPANVIKWKTSLGVFKARSLATQDLAWSPAGYAVVATGGVMGDESAFTVRAFASSQFEPLWTFTHSDLQALELALALAIGHYGEVYAGGSGANGHPAVAFIGG